MATREVTISDGVVRGTFFCISVFPESMPGIARPRVAYSHQVISTLLRALETLPPPLPLTGLWRLPLSEAVYCTFEGKQELAAPRAGSSSSPVVGRPSSSLAIL